MNRRQKRKYWKRRLEQTKKQNYQERTIFYSREACRLCQEGKTEKEMAEYLQFLREELQLNVE